MTKILYTTKATATGGRTGSAQTEDGNLKVQLVTAKELGGAGGEGTNPEQLFACGYSACFLGALKAAAGKEKVKIPDDATVTATFVSRPASGGGGAPPPSPPPIPKPKPKPLTCKKGFVKKMAHGKLRCVRKRKHHRHH